MADVRLILLAALAACTPADAQPKSGIQPPPGWTPQPAIASAAKAALGKQTIDAVEAHGEPAMGCYLLWMSVRGSGSAKDIAAQVVKGLADPAAERPLALTDVVQPTTEAGVLSFTFASAPYTGRLRATVGNGKIDTLACFWSEREPAACSTACTKLFAGGAR